MIDNFNIIFIIVFILIVLGFIFTFVMMFSSKARAKFMSNQIKSIKYMTEYSKDDIHDIGTNFANVSIKTKKDILDENEEILKNMKIRESNIRKEGIKNTVSAIKDGILEEMIKCDNCGLLIPADSKFCKECGKKIKD